MVGRQFIGKDGVALILGDNIFYGQGFQEMLSRSARGRGRHPLRLQRQGPRTLRRRRIRCAGPALSLEEKPPQPKSKFAVTGLYFYDNQVVEIAANLKPSPRGELEITDVNREYLHADSSMWKSSAAASPGSTPARTNRSIRRPTLLQTLESRQGLKIACIEEVALHMGFITPDQVLALAGGMKNEYGDYLRDIAATHPAK